MPVGHKKQVEQPGVRCVIGDFYLLNPIKWCKQTWQKKRKEKKKRKFLLKKMEVFLFSRAVESNTIYSDRAGFLDEVNRHFLHKKRIKTYMSELNPKRIKMEIALEAVPDNGIIIDIVDKRGQKLQDYKVCPGISMFKVFNNFCNERNLVQGDNFFYFQNEVIPPGRRASDIGLENGSEICHIHVLGIFNPELMFEVSRRPTIVNLNYGLFGEEGMAIGIGNLVVRNNLVTVEGDGLLLFESYRVRDEFPHEFFLRKLYTSDHLEVQEEELLFKVETICRSGVLVKKLMFQEQCAVMVLGTWYNYALWRMLALGLSNYYTTLSGRPRSDFVAVILFEQLLEMITFNFVDIVWPGEIHLLKNVFGVDFRRSMRHARMVIRLFGDRYAFLEGQLALAEARVWSLHRPWARDRIRLESAMCSICFELLSSNSVGFTSFGHSYHRECWGDYCDETTDAQGNYRCPNCRRDNPNFLNTYFS